MTCKDGGTRNMSLRGLRAELQSARQAAAVIQPEGIAGR